MSTRALRVVVIIGMLWISGAGKADAADALVMAGSGGLGLYPTIVSHITTYLTDLSYTVTTVTVLPSDLSPYAQVWDVRFDAALLAGETTTYSTYLAAGGSLFLMGENPGFNTRNNTLISYVAALGGGALGVLGSTSAAQTIQAPFTGPNPLTTITYAGGGEVASAGTGTFITTDGTGGTAINFGPGALSGATAGALIVVFDVNIIYDTGNLIEIAFVKNLISYLAAPSGTPTPTPTPPTPTAFAPTITDIPSQLVPIGSTTTVNFRVAGAIIPPALRVRAVASNLEFVSGLALTMLDQDGRWTLAVTAGDGRVGSATITITVSDGTRETITSFTVTTNVPTAHAEPTNLVATASGSGIALTWGAPQVGSPARYAVSGKISSGAANSWVFVTPDAATSYTIAMVPPGTYFFNVQAIGDELSLPSNEATVTTTGSSSVMGVPTGIVASVDANNITVRWMAPGGPTPSMYLVEFGAAPGHSEVALVTSVAQTYTRPVPKGFYFMRVRSFNGGAASAPSNEVSISASPDQCVAAPYVPVLLPPTVVGSSTSFSWLPPVSTGSQSGTLPDRYRLDLTDASGVVTSVATVGAGSSTTWTAPSGSYRARVTAGSLCGISAPSNEIAFIVP